MSSTTAYQEKERKTSSLALLKRLERKFEFEAKETEPIIFNNSVEQTAWYTGFHPNFLKQIRNKSYTLNEINFNIDRSQIHNTLMYHYLCKNTLLTPWQAFNVLRPKIPPYMDIYEFKQMLKRLNYTFPKIGKNRVVIEKPTVYFERYQYLKNIHNARLEKKTIYYITEFAYVNGNFLTVTESVDLLKKQPNVKQELYRMAVSDNGINFLSVLNFSPQTFESCFGIMLRNLNESSVIVIDDEEHQGREMRVSPDINSLKYEMMNWLNLYDVPYDEDMTKFELMDLIEKFTMDKKMYKIDEMANLHHQLLRLPECIRALSVGHLVLKMIEMNHPEIPEGTKLIDIAHSIKKEIITSFHEYITVEEDELLHFDTKFDEKYDSLVEKARSSARNELPDTSSSDSD